MSSSNGGGEMEAAGPPQSLTPESSALFGEGIALVLSRWFALQVAIENQWGDGDSRQKSHDLASAIFSWFSQSKEPLYIDDLEAVLDESMVDLFSTEVEDGSIEEVAEQLMVMHEDCLKGNYESIEKLRKLVPVTNVVSHNRQVINDDEDESSDEEGSDMMVDEQQPEMAVDNPTREDIPHKPKGPDEEGWTVVAPKRNKGRKSR